MASWRCIAHCGACCHLDPVERPDLADYLSPDELRLYLSMVGEDGWCIHFDAESRRCRIYADRPRFCRVEPDIFHDMYGIAPEEMDEFAIDCCTDQIDAVHGDRSDEARRFRQATGAADPLPQTQG